MEDYQQHRRSALEAICSLYAKYEWDYSAALETDGAAFAEIERALAGCGQVRLYKYQPFTERNLADCSSGVLHLTPLPKLNDVNEGVQRFDIQYASGCLGDIDPEQISTIDFEAMPQFVRDIADDDKLSEAKEHLAQMKRSGELQFSIAPSLANMLETSFRDMRNSQLCGSLSETVRSASMWDRYANAHKGFAAGYVISSFSAELTRSRDKACTLGYRALIAPVYYGGRLTMTALAAASQIHDPNGLHATNVSSLMLVMSLLQKSKEWEHELEWRAIANACPNGTGVQYCRMRPDSIYLGIDMQEDERNRAIEVAVQNGWHVFQMEKSLDSPDWALEGKQHR